MQEKSKGDMRKFSDLNITLYRRFTGQRIRINIIIGSDIIIHDFDFRKSKICKDDGKDICLYLDVEINKERRIIWGNYPYLIKQLEQVDRTNLPFSCKIINDRGYIIV